MPIAYSGVGTFREQRAENNGPCQSFLFFSGNFQFQMGHLTGAAAFFFNFFLEIFQNKILNESAMNFENCPNLNKFYGGKICLNNLEIGVESRLLHLISTYIPK